MLTEINRTDTTVAPVSHYANGDRSALLHGLDALRLVVSRTLNKERRSEMGQFMTPASAAIFMASLFEQRATESLHLLDAGAGIGVLSAAWIAEVCGWARRPREITVTAFEIDAVLTPYLEDTLDQCAMLCACAGIAFRSEIRQEDFIDAAVGMVRNGLFAAERERFDCALLNPPYRKIHSASKERRLLRSIGIETSNLYTGFLSLAVQLLRPSGEMVAITPRSFCNGPYFRPFRQFFLREMSPRQFHVFDTRDKAFGDDSVLQETIIVSAVKDSCPPKRVLVSSSESPDDGDICLREANFSSLVHPNDPDRVIHLVLDGLDQHVTQRMEQWTTPLAALGLTVSTGRVVDFRARDHLRSAPGPSTVPLIYPEHCIDGYVTWPKKCSRKPQAIVNVADTAHLLIPVGTYVVVKRFSAKEERRRIVAAVYDPTRVTGSRIGFENHLNYYHDNGQGLPPDLARGLAAFLNSSMVDAYFRQFSGHTQVNAADLRKLRYPPRQALEALGARIGNSMPEQEDLDRLITKELLHMPDHASASDPLQAQSKIANALAILKDLGLPREQQNERSALTLLALLDLQPGMSWSTARNPLRGITPMMEFFKDAYGKEYAPNTRETVRRFTIHQFVDAGLVVENPDKPDRPVNSPDYVYQIETSALEMLRTYGTDEWESNLQAYLASRQTLQEQYAREREMTRIPVALSSGETIPLSAGGQNILVKEIIEQFCPRFTPGATVIYVGDTAEKFAYFDQELLSTLGVTIETHGKMPDVIVHHEDKGRLVLIEAVTSHGPVNPKRYRELKTLFAGSAASLIYVTAFLNRKAMAQYLADISWETEVWVADAPSHMIHFNGERFLGP